MSRYDYWCPWCPACRLSTFLRRCRACRVHGRVVTALRRYQRRARKRRNRIPNGRSTATVEVFGLSLYGNGEWERVQLLGPLRLYQGRG